VLHSHAIAPAQFVGPGLCYAKPLSGPPNRRIQPERYAPFFEKVKKVKILTKY
jgi:hypothetical protein